ncbi:acyltransferase family protein [Microbacterium marmarense]|uniref:Acyltransferase family protein n=1 Tax=Microbacterium marmarense TaxID=3122051 RepID=A0ABU8LW58_9MICO
MIVKTNTQRKTWIDVGKGLCIVLVVLMHVSLWIENEFNEGPGAFWWLFSEALVPIRMPLFFFLSGYLAANAIKRPLGQSKARTIGFYYIYVLWTALFLLRLWLPVPGFDDQPTAGQFLLALVLPTSFWYLWALAVFFLIAWAAYRFLGENSKWLIVPLFGLALTAPAVDAVFRPVLAPPADPLMFGHMSVNFVWFFAGVHGRKVWDSLMNRATLSRVCATTAAYAVAVGASALFDTVVPMRAVLAAVGLLAIANVLAFLPLQNKLVKWLEQVGSLTLPVYIFHIFALSALSGIVKLTGVDQWIMAFPQLFGALLPPAVALSLVVASAFIGKLILRSPLSWSLSPRWLQPKTKNPAGPPPSLRAAS